MAETRDFVMARLAAAKVFNDSVGEAITACLEHFIGPDEDKKGAERKEALEAASDSAGEVSRSIELAQAAMDAMEEADLLEEEPELEDPGEGA